MRSGTSSDRWVKIANSTRLAFFFHLLLLLLILQSFTLSLSRGSAIVTCDSTKYSSPFVERLLSSQLSLLAFTHACKCLLVSVYICVSTYLHHHPSPLLLLSLSPASLSLFLSAWLTGLPHHRAPLRHDTTIHFSWPHERRLILCILLSSSFFFLSSPSPPPLLVRLCIFPSSVFPAHSFPPSLSLSFQSVCQLIAPPDFRDHEDDLHSDHTLHYRCCILSPGDTFSLSRTLTHGHISLTSYSPVDALSRSSFHSPSHANAV